jgi:hypothetical protein
MNDGNLVLEGKYFDLSDAGSVSSKVFEACVEVMEHQGASDIKPFSEPFRTVMSSKSDLSRVKACLVELPLQLAGFALF